MSSFFCNRGLYQLLDVVTKSVKETFGDTNLDEEVDFTKILLLFAKVGERDDWFCDLSSDQSIKKFLLTNDFLSSRLSILSTLTLHRPSTVSGLDQERDLQQRGVHQGVLLRVEPDGECGGRLLQPNNRGPVRVPEHRGLQKVSGGQFRAGLHHHQGPNTVQMSEQGEDPAGAAAAAHQEGARGEQRTEREGQSDRLLPYGGAETEELQRERLRVHYHFVDRFSHLSRNATYLIRKRDLHPFSRHEGELLISCSLPNAVHSIVHFLILSISQCNSPLDCSRSPRSLKIKIRLLIARKAAITEWLLVPNDHTHFDY